MVAACATPQPRGGSADADISGALEAVVAQGAEAPVPPPDVAAALLPPIEVPPVAGPVEPRFNVDVSNAPARAFFMGLVEGTDRNMVVHPELDGRVSLTMKNVTVPEVLEAVREVYGYEYRRNGTGYVLLPPTMQTRVFQIDYLNLSRAGVSRTRISSGQVSETRRGDTNQSADEASTDSDSNNRDVAQVTGSRIDTMYHADFWAELDSTVCAIVGTGGGRQVVVNAQTGVLLVRAMPAELRAVDQYLALVQSTAQRQVILEAKIIEVQLNDLYQAGVNWAMLTQNSSGDSYFLGQFAPTGELDNIGGSPITVEPGTVVTGFDTTTVGSAFTMAFDIGDFNTFIELLEVQGDARVLSSPRVSTLNNQKAVIKAGTDEFFVTDVSSNTVTGTSSTTSRDVTLTPFFSGIALDVTPQISAQGDVILHIHPTVSDVVDQDKLLTIGGETDSLPLALSEVRESDSIVRARSGQVIVIGGLMRSTEREEGYAAPILGSLPGVGALFRSDRTETRKSELVILLKPIVVDDDRTWSTVAGEHLDRMRALTGD